MGHPYQILLLLATAVCIAAGSSETFGQYQDQLGQLESLARSWRGITSKRLIEWGALVRFDPACPRFVKYPVRLNQLEALARSDQRHRFTRGIDGGVSCAACSVLLGMAVQLGADTRPPIMDCACANSWKCRILPVSHL